MSANELVFHFRSPTESGDLYRTALPTKENASLPTTTVRRLTETMSLSLKSKLVRPREVRICNEGSPDETRMHALLYVGDDDDKDENKNKPLQPLLWLHGGPMCQYSYDFNPLLSWLASCGYLVLAPNFSGSTGSGLDHMQRVLGAGCGVADLSDCLACAKWLKANSCEEPRLDLSRGIAVAGHSWGGYLALMCLLESDEKTGESVFSCGIASAGITDWFLQQRYTEVRYYDYALLGGWVYDPIVGARARKVSPQTRVAVDLRAPLLVLHGDQDQDVPFRQIPPFVEAAKQSPHPLASVEYHVYQGEGHGMSGSSEVQADYLNRIRTFLRIHLKPWDFTSNPHGDLTAY
jgi:dipeptidyl aminopeptidase/acylaminoacyl peptidase